ncbi:serine protease 33-like isoform X2 [Babylonia areolata]|uniref:serine protease 33-like isoform X2 n=1 Tax=Babylonia areolata TaxID=304850 RepID=UPI003FD2ECF0
MFRYFICLVFCQTILFFSWTVMTTPTAVNSGCGASMVRVTRIVGGDSAPSGSWPWMVSLRHLTGEGVFRHHCGASLISALWLLTAAHCFHGSNDSLQWRARLGRTETPSAELDRQDLEVAHVETHPHFNVSGHGNDIALVRLARPLSSLRVEPICLPRPGQDVVGDGTGCYVTGWGDTRGTGDGAWLQQVELPVIDRWQCGQWYNETITSDAFCAGFTSGGKDACKGDSGGPYACPREGVWVQGGLVSWGKDCGAIHLPGVYTSIQYHLPWIYDVTSRYDSSWPSYRN